jgi:hypothetical protein
VTADDRSGTDSGRFGDLRGREQRLAGQAYSDWRSTLDSRWPSDAVGNESKATRLAYHRCATSWLRFVFIAGAGTGVLLAWAVDRSSTPLFIAAGVGALIAVSLFSLVISRFRKGMRAFPGRLSLR